MIKQNPYLKNNFQEKKNKKGLSKDYLKSINEIKYEIKNKKKTLNVLSKDFKFNFKINDLNKFNKYKTIALVGMGGSILGAEAISNFLEKKISVSKFSFCLRKFSNVPGNPHPSSRDAEARDLFALPPPLPTLLCWRKD